MADRSDTGASTPALPVVSFVAGGFRFAVEARQVRLMLAHREEGIDSIAAEDLIGLPLGIPGPRRWLVLSTQARHVEVSEPVEFQALTAEQIFPLPPLVAARMSLKGIRAVAIDRAGLILLIDPESLRPAA